MTCSGVRFPNLSPSSGGGTIAGGNVTVVTTSVLISGFGGRMASEIADAIASTEDLVVAGGYNPRRAEYTDSDVDADVVLEVTRPEVVMGNLRRWQERGLPCVVGTSGFTAESIEEVRSFWGADDPACLIVPNFSIGAVLMIRFAEAAASWFEDVEIVERHHADKPDAPSGTAINTAERIASVGGAASVELDGAAAHGELHHGIAIHSMRHEGVVAQQEVFFSGPGESLRIEHVSGDRASFRRGALVALRAVTELRGVHVGLDEILIGGSSGDRPQS
ncbi:MAG: 4-hydroxy-tetrahydrodipicolinate reductase [Acidimicrobiia bacterium]|nr:4-hydroxy-tetrahydrodipicolinate reductase [Acidimicrobiia bacterium]